MAEAKVGILVSAKDEASAKLKTVQKSLGDLDKTAKTSASGVKGLTGDIGGMIAVLGGIGIGVAGFAALGAAIGDLAQRGLQVKALESSFENMAAGVGESSSRMLSGLRAASQGMISDRDLILSANRAMMLGVAQSTEEMSSLLQVAAVRGQALGLSVSQAFSDIVTGIGRMSPLILDNLGIVTGGEKVFDDYAKSIGKATAQLTDLERKQALVNSVMASTDTSTGIAQNGFAALDASMTNLGDAIGKLLVDGTPLVQMLNDIAGAVQNMTQAIDESSNLGQIMAGTGLGNVGTVQGDIDAVRGRMSYLKDSIHAANVELERLSAEGFANLAASLPMATDVQIFEILNKNLAGQRAVVDDLNSEYAKLTSTLSELYRTMPVQGPQAGGGAIDLSFSWGKNAIDAAAAYGAETGAAFAQARERAVAASTRGMAGLAQDVARRNGRDMGLAFLDGYQAELSRMWDSWQAQGFSSEQITNVLQPIFEQSFREINTTAAASGKTIGQQLAESLRGSIESQLQAKAIDLAFSVEPSLNRAAEGAEWLDAKMRTVAQSTAYWAAEVDAGRMSVSEATIAAEMLGTQISQAADDTIRINNGLLAAGPAAYALGQNLAAGMQGALNIVNEILGKFGQAVSAGAGFVAKTLISLPPGVDQAINEKAYQTFKKTGDLQASLTQKEAERLRMLQMWPSILKQANGDIEVGQMLFRRETDAINEQTAALTRLAGGGGGGVAAVSQAWENLRGKVQSVISQARSADIGGLNPADFLPREDAINENARRLAAIMRDGLAGQEWLPEFQMETGGLFDELIASGDVRGAAARILQEFQAGMRPELLDREQVKENVRRMILGEQSMAELADQIARELAAETGTSLARVQAMVGTQLGTTPGAGMPQAVGEGADGGTQAESFVSGWVATMNRLYARIYETGAQSGTQWGAGFMATVEGGVPGALIGLLVGLVTPGVMAQIAAQQSTAGAR